GLVLAAAAVAVSIVSPGGAPPVDSQPAKPVSQGEAPYSRLVQAMRHGRVRTVEVDGATGRAQVGLADGFYVEVVLPPDDSALLPGLAARGAAVQVHAPKGASTSLFQVLLPPLLLVALFAGFVALARRRGGSGAAFGAGVVDTSLPRSVELSE